MVLAQELTNPENHKINTENPKKRKWILALKSSQLGIKVKKNVSQSI